MEKTLIDKLAYIYVKDRKVLVSLSNGKDTWYIPGGKREGDESDEQSLVREVQEELSVDIRPETMHLYGVFRAQAHGKPEGVKVRMTCYTADFDGKLRASSEIAQIDFFGYGDVDKCGPVDHLIFEDLYNKGLIAK